MKTNINQFEQNGHKDLFVKVAALVTVFAFVLTLTLVFLPSSGNVAEAAVLKQGSTGTLVKTMQTKLIRWGYLTGTADGVFGPKTKAAVILFQKRNGLVADGIVGTKTAQAMGISLSSATTTSSSSSASSICSRTLYTARRVESPTLGKWLLRQLCSTGSRAQAFQTRLRALYINPAHLTV